MEVGRLIRCDADSYADDRERGDRHVDQQQDLPRCYREYEAAHRRPDGEPDQPYGRDEGDHTNAQAVFLEQPEGQRHRPWCGHRGRNPHRHSDGDELVRRGDKGGRQAGNAEQGQPDEHDPSPAEPIGDRTEHQHQAAEDNRVGAGHPLQRSRRSMQVTADRGQRDVQDRVVQHFEEEHRREARQRHPRLPQRPRHERCSSHEHRPTNKLCSCQVLRCSDGREKRFAWPRFP